MTSSPQPGSSFDKFEDEFAHFEKLGYNLVVQIGRKWGVLSDFSGKYHSKLGKRAKK